MNTNPSKSHIEKMLQHAQHVLGVQVLFAPASAAWAWDNIPMLPMTTKGLQRSTTEHRNSPAMLLPRNSELFSIFTDERHGLFVQAQGCEDLFVLQARWAVLKLLLPANSSCLVVAYENKANVLMLGVFDVLRVEGVDRSAVSVFDRQAELFSLFQKAPKLQDIEQHWVGLEHALVSYMQIPEHVRSLPFEVDHMLRLLSGEQKQKQFHLLLRPIITNNLNWIGQK
jgi:hypothetical protein